MKLPFLMLRHQLKNCRSLLRGEKILIPSLGSMTLDRDDVALTRHILKNPEDWYDSTITNQFEDKFAKWNNSKHAFSFMGGRVALSACLAGLDLKPEDEIILPGYTCVVVPNAIKFAGLKPVFADIELETYGLSLEDVKRKVTKNTRAVIIQHLFGLVCKEIDAILLWAKKRNIFVIEDLRPCRGSYLPRQKGRQFRRCRVF